MLENLVLYYLDALTPEDYANLASIEERLRRTYRRDGDWINILQGELHLPPIFGEKVRAIWVKNQRFARENGESLDPVAFARMFVDANFGNNPE